MLQTPVPSAEEAQANTAFDALLWALSRPGTPRTLPQPGEHAIINALLDRECRAYSADPLLIPNIMRTGAELSDIDSADHVFLGAQADTDVIAQIAVGTDLYPDEGATLILRCGIGSGPVHRLTGPGVDSAITVALDALPEGFWAARAARLRYPTGFDLFLVDGTSVIGIPRSTGVEVL